MLSAPGSLEAFELQPPAPGSDEALVRVRSVGICGTDRKIVSGSIPVAYPRIIGHEIVGVVVEAPDGSDLRPGTRVLVDPGVTCGTCRPCRAGRENICTGGWLLGRDRDGGLRELMEVPAANLHALPDAVEDHLGPLIQVLATCVHAQRLVDVFPGENVAILGLGVTGMLHLQLAKLRGARVIGVTRSPAKLELAAKLGADLAFPSDATAAERIASETGGGADLVIECVGSVDTLATAISAASVGGRVLAYGTIAETAGALPFYDLYYKEIALTNARSARAEDFPAAIDAVASGRVAIEPLLTRRFDLGSAGEAIEAAGWPGAMKIVIDL